ncbi:hypothetical protein ACFL4E_00705 [Candidatus Omnitrophota bacterium]
MKKILVKIIILIFCAVSFNAAELYAAVGCTLNDPDRDVKRIFPGSTGYKTEFITIKEVGGEELAVRIEKRLGDKFETEYETIDVPYAFYTVLKGKEAIGRIHGVNQKGTYGGIQLIVATDLDGEIKDFYYQKLSAPEARKFRDKEFTGQFTGLTLEDFYDEGRVVLIKDPSSESEEDFRNTLRGLKKNMILLDEFKLNKSGLREEEK